MYASHDDLVYLAGLVDGEGTIRIHRHHPKTNRVPSHLLELSVANTYRPVLEWVKERFGGQVVSRGIRPRSIRPGFTWQLRSTSQVANILRRLTPFLQIKWQQAELGINFALASPPHHRGKKLLTEEELALREGYFLALKTANQNPRYKA